MKQETAAQRAAREREELRRDGVARRPDAPVAGSVAKRAAATVQADRQAAEVAKAAQWTDAKLEAWHLPAGKVRQRLSVARRLYCEVTRGKRGEGKRWWLAFYASKGRKATRLSLGAFPAVTVAKAVSMAEAILTKERRGELVRKPPRIQPSDAFVAGFVAGFAGAAPVGYDVDTDSAAAQPWCAPWTWADGWHVAGLTPSEMGAKWARKCAAEMLKVLAAETGAAERRRAVAEIVKMLERQK